MVIDGRSEQFLCAGGKFFVMYDYDTDSKPMYRQIECYLPASTGCHNEPIEATMARRLAEFEAGKDFRWAIGSTGSLLTARYKVRESDGELVSLLALNGGIAKG